MMQYNDNEILAIITEVKNIATGQETRDTILQAICELLKSKVSYYDWVGFYIADEQKQQLILGPYIGEPTEHTRISFGQGICGQAAAIKKPLIVQDVSKETNYLSCSVRVMSEIVLPIMKGDHVLGELDIDSHTISPFSEKDTRLLTGICEFVAKFF
jgi:GAF domain-containing protein